MISGIPTLAVLAVEIVLQAVFIGRALLRPGREPSSRIAWVLVILAVPLLGMLAYLLFGETNIGRRRAARYQVAAQRLEALAKSVRLPDGRGSIWLQPQHRHLFQVGESISGFRPMGGNRAEIMADSNAAIDALIADIDAASTSVHLLFYIWLADTNGLKVAEAAKRAARRGVTVRVMADDLGSRAFIRSAHWGDMARAGVRLARALPMRTLFLHPIGGRIDLRNHRKIMVIDNRITYCGSQNCADPEFAVKPRYAPWVDVMVRFEGPIALQNQALFVQDWVTHTDETLADLINYVPAEADRSGVIAQAIGTGPTVRASAMPEMFEALMHAARRGLTITTPYYVPSESMNSALCSAGRRGVNARLVVPARNDSRIVAAASRSYYAELVEAGVQIFEYQRGLLHAKTLTVDDEVALIGSANLDRRSFDLNFENNILLKNIDLVTGLRTRQAEFIADSLPVSTAEIQGWSIRRRLWQNSVAMIGPIL